MNVLCLPISSSKTKVHKSPEGTLEQITEPPAEKVPAGQLIQLPEKRP